MVIDGYLSFSSPSVCGTIRAFGRATRRTDEWIAMARGSRDPKKRYGGRSPPAGGLDGLVSCTQKPWFVCVVYESMHRSVGVVMMRCTV